MMNATQFGTRMGAAAWLLSSIQGCGHGPATHADAATGSCTFHQECALVPNGCCAACNPGVDDVEAVLVKDMQVPCEVACGACAELPAHEIVSQLRAACIAQRCQVIDLRTRDVTACEQDDDCELRSRNCCNGCGEDPALWLALRKGASDTTAPECDPIPPCAACPTQARPVAYCAADKHCAVRAAE